MTQTYGRARGACCLSGSGATSTLCHFTLHQRVPFWPPPAGSVTRPLVGPPLPPALDDLFHVCPGVLVIVCVTFSSARTVCSSCTPANVYCVFIHSFLFFLLFTICAGNGGSVQRLVAAGVIFKTARICLAVTVVIRHAIYAHWLPVV